MSTYSSGYGWGCRLGRGRDILRRPRSGTDCPQALGPRDHLGFQRPVRRQDSAREGGAVALGAVPQREGRDRLSPQWGDEVLGADGGKRGAAGHATEDGRGVPDHAGNHPLHRGRHRLRRAGSEHAASRRRRPPQGPLRTRGNERTMKVIIPLAGKGTRLRPHTHLVPKPMLKIAGKPVMAYILEDLERLGGVEQVVYVTGHLKEKVEHYAKTQFKLPAAFVEQTVQDGTAGAVKLAQPFVDQDVLIIFVDTIFETDLSVIKTTDADGIIWVKEVEDYQRFGVVVTDKDGNMTKIVEKPDTPISKRANIGLYYVKNWKLLYEGIDHVLEQPKNKGEYYLTDAFQYMIDKGAKIRVIDVEGWYDAGKIDTLLETNRVMLEKGHARKPRATDGSTIIDPVYIEDDVVLKGARIGPNVSIGRGSVIERSELKDTLVGSNTKIVGSVLENSLIGDSAVIEGVKGELTLSDHSEVRSR